MNYSARAMAIEAELNRKSVEDYARLQAMVEPGDDGAWVEGVSYSSDYLTIINLGQGLRQAS